MHFYLYIIYQNEEKLSCCCVWRRKQIHKLSWIFCTWETTQPIERMHILVLIPVHSTTELYHCTVAVNSTVGLQFFLPTWMRCLKGKMRGRVHIKLSTLLPVHIVSGWVLSSLSSNLSSVNQLKLEPKSSELDFWTQLYTNVSPLLKKSMPKLQGPV